MNDLIINSIIWNVVGSIGSAVASIAALITVIITIRNNKNNNDEKQFSVQPWFHVTTISRMGSNSPIKLVVLNDASPSIKVDKVIMTIECEGRETELLYKYLKIDNKFIETGRCFEITINNDKSLFGKSAKFEIYYTNLYKRKMKSVSPNFQFINKNNDNSLLDIKSEGLLFIPFNNEIVK